jgi:hypothetical protein
MTLFGAAVAPRGSAMKIRCLMSVFLVVGFACLGLLSQVRIPPFSIPFVPLLAHSSAGVVYAAQGGETSPYGGAQSGSYGEKRQVTSKEEARKILQAYFAKQNVTIGEIVEQDLYYEAEILDKNKKVTDKVIINKRTGRIRSIF